MRFHPFPTFYKKGIIEMAKIVTFGEIMLRLTPPGHLRFVQANSFDVIWYSGQCPVSLAITGMNHLRPLPKHEITEHVNALRRYGVNLSRTRGRPHRHLLS